MSRHKKISSLCNVYSPNCRNYRFWVRTYRWRWNTTWKSRPKHCWVFISKSLFMPDMRF